MKYLPLYKKWIVKERLPKPGLCDSLYGNQMLKMFDCCASISYVGYDGMNRNFMNNYLGATRSDVIYDFTPLRQNIILLMAAMNNEL